MKRTRDAAKGRQVDCIRGNRAYEFKIRVTIAASGQGRWSEELEFPIDCRGSGYLPVLVVLDPTTNPKLTELTRAFKENDGEVLGVVKQALTEPAVAALETPTGRAPSWLTPAVVRNASGGFDLYPHSLYWGTRRMVERLTRDRTRMQQAVALFATMTTPAP